MNSFSKEFEWQKQFLPQISNILKQNAMHLVSIEVAPEYDDCHKATDLVIKLNGIGSVAVRVRRWRLNYRSGKPYRDFTIRSKVISNARTEIHKLRDGFARWYLYCWLDKPEKNISSYILVDLDLIRKHGCLDVTMKWPTIPNGDGTEFIAIEPAFFNDLDNNIIISYQKDDYLILSY